MGSEATKAATQPYIGNVIRPIPERAEVSLMGIRCPATGEADGSSSNGVELDFGKNGQLAADGRVQDPPPSGLIRRPGDPE